MRYAASGIEAAKAILKQKQHAYLRSRGWVHTSQNPGYLWLWLRSIDGIVYAVDTLTAIRIQQGRPQDPGFDEPEPIPNWDQEGYLRELRAKRKRPYHKAPEETSKETPEPGLAAKLYEEYKKL